MILRLQSLFAKNVVTLAVVNSVGRPAFGWVWHPIAQRGCGGGGCGGGRKAHAAARCGAGMLDFGICLAVGKRDAGAICRRVGEGLRAVAQLAVIATPPAAEGGVAGADCVTAGASVGASSSGVAF